MAEGVIRAAATTTSAGKEWLLRNGRNSGAPYASAITEARSMRSGMPTHEKQRKIHPPEPFHAVSRQRPIRGFFYEQALADARVAKKQLLQWIDDSGAFNWIGIFDRLIQPIRSPSRRLGNLFPKFSGSTATA